MGIVEFIEKNIKLNNKPIKLYDYQIKILKDPSDFRIINKARQIGITQLISWESLVYALANENELIGIVSVSERQAKDVLGYISGAYYSLPPELRLKLDVETKQEFKFENNSRILSLPNNARTVRGRPYTRLYLDELAHYQEDKEMIDAILPGISRGGKATFISTPLGKQGEFWRMWSEAEGISKHEIPFTECADMVVRINMLRAKMDEERFRQEYMCAFIDESTSMFPFELIKKCIDYDLKNEIIETRNPIYIGIDFGKKIDSTVIIAVEKTNDKFIVRYINEMVPPTTYTEASNFIIRNSPRWNPTKIVVDQTGVGENVIENLKPLGSLVQGEVFTAPFKEKIIQNLKVVMQDGRLIIPNDENLFNQLHSLQKTVGESGTVKYKHPTEGKIQHDDYVWALALAVSAGDVQSGAGTSPVFISGSTFKLNKEEDRFRTFRKDY